MIDLYRHSQVQLQPVPQLERLHLSALDVSDWVLDLLLCLAGGQRMHELEVGAEERTGAPRRGRTCRGHPADCFRGRCSCGAEPTHALVCPAFLSSRWRAVVEALRRLRHLKRVRLLRSAGDSLVRALLLHPSVQHVELDELAPLAQVRRLGEG